MKPGIAAASLVASLFLPASAQVTGGSVSPAADFRCPLSPKEYSEILEMTEAAVRAVNQAAVATISINGGFDATQAADIACNLLSRQSSDMRRLLGALSAIQELTKARPSAADGVPQKIRVALETGDLARADSLLVQIAGPGSLQALATGARGWLANLRADFLGGAALFAAASEALPTESVEQRWAYRLAQASAQDQRFRRFNDVPRFEAALRVFETVVLPLAPRDKRPRAWAETQVAMADMFRAAGARGVPDGLLRAAQAYEAALTVLTQESYPEDSATIQFELGDTYRHLAELRGGQDRGLAYADRAIRAYRAALPSYTATEPGLAGWLNTSLAQLYLDQHGRGSTGMLALARAAAQSAIECYQSDGDSASVERAQNLLDSIPKT